jgi:transglutaminase-like putative cysteine protease
MATLLRLLAVMTLVLAPHVTRLPLWEVAFIAALLAWRATTALRGWRMPPMWIRVALTLMAFAGVQVSFHRFSGQVAGTALLCVMVALKVLELRARRDVIVLVFMLYFILMTQFLDSQELWTVVYLFGCAIAITGLLADCHHPGAPLPLRETLRRGVAMVVQALPLMVTLFILFPRIPGPLWGLPTDAGAARSGLSDSMTPGDIASLIESTDAVAFRVDFHGQVPPQYQLYWRGPVFDAFDGRTWNRAYTPNPAAVPDIQPQGSTVYRYDVTLEPNRMPWLFAIEAVVPRNLPPRAFVTPAGELQAGEPVRDRLVYSVASTPHFVLTSQLSAFDRAVTLRLPNNFNPRTLELGAHWRAEGLPATALAQRALGMFRHDGFSYTLKPPTLGRDSVDEFLFETRRGFCEHYASSFTILMRAAGVPARVVTGYLGGERNAVGDYYVVNQSDAHAWSEIWIEGSGWTRVDPTAAVAPDRVEHGLESALNAAHEGMPGYLSLSTHTQLRVYLAVHWDWINSRWNALVLAYGPQLQQDFLSRFGIDDMGSMIMALTIISMVMLSVVGLVLLRQFAPAHGADAALRHWQRATRKLRRKGLGQRPDEGPRDFIERVARQRPDLSPMLQPLLEAYLGLRYLGAIDPGTERRLAAAVRGLRP